MSTDAANHGTGRDSRNPAPAGIGQVSQQVALKGQSAHPPVLGTLDALVVLMAVRAFGCNGPTGPCALPFGHDGDHERSAK